MCYRTHRACLQTRIVCSSTTLCCPSTPIVRSGATPAATATAATSETTSPASTITSPSCSPTPSSLPSPSSNVSLKPSSLVGISSSLNNIPKFFVDVSDGQISRLLHWVTVFGFSQHFSIGAYIIQALLECGDTVQALQQYTAYEAQMDRGTAEQLLHCLMRTGVPKNTASKDVHNAMLSVIIVNA